MPEEEIKESPEEKGTEETGDESTESQQGEFNKYFLEANTEGKTKEKDEKKLDEKEEAVDTKSEEKKDEKKDEKAEEKEPEEKDESVKVKDEKKEKEAKAEGDKEEKPEDEAAKRGQEIIDETKEADRATKESEAVAREEDRVKQEASAAKEVIPLSDTDAEFFRGLISKGRLPDKIKVQTDEGEVEVDIKTILNDSPEIQIISTLQTQELMMNWFKQGHIISKAQATAAIEKEIDSVYEEFYGLSVVVHLQNAGHMGVDLENLMKSDGFKEWGNKQPAEVKALFDSNAKDYAMGVGQYLLDAGMKKGKETVAKIDKKAREVKEKHVDLHKSTMESSGEASGEAIISDEKAEYKKDFREANEKLEKEG
ncbi:MAG TPA: hypothetical protein ENI07_14950 [Desulfobacterales bacterium]|nr:hypothetical protein [Desulfobacterales bacterium]